METLVRTPQAIFMMPQRLKVPLFQRPYVWNQERQWEPLWNDVIRVAERLRKRPTDKAQPHFLGAVVMQQVPTQAGLMMERTVIDGQQRLTTLQLMLDALHAELQAVNATTPSMRLEPLIANAAPFCTAPEDRFKVWPTNRDRPAFMAVMAAAPPVDHDAVGHKGERMVEAHRFFSQQARQWLAAGGQAEVEGRASVIETVVRELLQMVVIDLGMDENAQEIFETLNDRGTPLTAADLVKNFVFQRLLDTGADVDVAYEENWKEFETGFWETETSVGRLFLPRSSVFLNHWLVARTGGEVVAREVFARFKSFSSDSGIPMPELIRQIRRAGVVYRDFTVKAESLTGPTDRLGLFGYRTGALEAGVIKPLVLHLLDPEQPPVAQDQLEKALSAVESWMVRRMLVRATTKAHNTLMAAIIGELRKGDRSKAGDIVEAFLAKQDGDSTYWPDDDEVRREVARLAAYRRLSRGRLRMVLEAIEDDLRGWKNGKQGLGGERVARGKLTVEHAMPQKWEKHWPPSDGFQGEDDRNQLIHTLGNLTLLTGPLNAKASNAPWVGAGGKRAALNEHDVLKLNRSLLHGSEGGWTDRQIRERTAEMAGLIVGIWPAPAGHRSAAALKTKSPWSVQLGDLIQAGLLNGGAVLYPRSKKYEDRRATVLSDGRIEVEGVIYEKPSPAASAMVGRGVNGWYFFLVDREKKRSLGDVFREYRESMAVEGEDVDAEDAEDE